MKKDRLIYLIPLCVTALLCGSIPASAGTIEDAGWARARLNDAADLERKSFVYPEANTAVRVYLIDTAVDNSSGWFDGNSKLTLHPSIYTGPAHLAPSKDTTHGSRVLGVIAGPGTGAMLGAPLEVVSYNVATAEHGVRLDLVAAALYEAVDHFQQNPGKPSVICLAVGSTQVGTELSSLKYAVMAAVEAGIPVITGAGNMGGSASDYLPSAYGTLDGVICVGGSTTANGRLPMSNQGDAVDLYAPGENVPTVNTSNPFGGSPYLMTGTSASTAIAAATALNELALNPKLSPGELETHLKEISFPSASLAVLQMSPVSDSDGDGSEDSIERFFGSDPLVAADRPKTPSPICTDGRLCLRFSISESLFDPSQPYVLKDGTTWRPLISGNFDAWAEATPNLTVGQPENGLVPITLSVTTGLKRTYLRLEILSPKDQTPPEPVVSLANALHGADWEEKISKDGAEYQALLVMSENGCVSLELVPLESGAPEL